MPNKDAAKAEIPDHISGYSNIKEDSQNDVEPGKETASETVPCNADVAERSRVEAAETEASNISQVGPQSTVPAKVEEERLTKNLRLLWSTCDPVSDVL